MWTWFYKLASPYVYRAAAAFAPWLLGFAGVAIAYGLVDGLAFAPPDYQQGDAFRIVYVHAPSAWMSTFVYTVMAIAGAIGLIWRIKIGHAVAAASAPVGASFTLAALLTGSCGKPMWGTYWAWDPRLTTELILLFLYVGVMSLRSAFEDATRGDRAAALLAIVGVVNVPIIHFSVTWWNSLHQAATVARLGKPQMDSSMLWPLLSMFLGFMLFYGGVLCVRLQGEILNRERQAAMDARGGEIVTHAAFWAMGGYARFVWPCFVFVCAVLLWNLWSARRYHASARVRAARAFAMNE